MKLILAMFLLLVLFSLVVFECEAQKGYFKPDTTYKISSVIVTTLRYDFRPRYVAAQDTTKVETIIGTDTLYTNNPYAVAALWTMVKWWKEYSLECYNDSTRWQNIETGWGGWNKVVQEYFIRMRNEKRNEVRS